MFEKMFEIYKNGGKECLKMDHYDLSETYPDYSPDQWREFLQDPQASLYAEQEFAVVRKAEMRKIMSDISDSNSVGKAQILNALSAQNEKAEGKKEGPIFIYTFIPPSEEQLKAPNVRIIDYAEAQRKGLQPEAHTNTEEKEIEKPKGDPRWIEN